MYKISEYNPQYTFEIRLSRLYSEQYTNDISGTYTKTFRSAIYDWITGHRENFTALLLGRMVSRSQQQNLFAGCIQSLVCLKQNFFFSTVVWLSKQFSLEVNYLSMQYTCTRMPPRNDHYQHSEYFWMLQKISTKVI